MGVLRFILALVVVIAHCTPIFGCRSVGSAVAVESFFIISGFYMSLVLNEKYVNENNSFRLFISNRLLRLFPVYWCVLVLVILFSLSKGIYSGGSNWGSLSSLNAHFTNMGADSIFLVLFSNIFIFFQDVMMFLGLGENGHVFFSSNFETTATPMYAFLLIPQAWTLGVELLFYMVAPFIVRKKLWLILLLILCSVLLRYILYQHGLKHEPWTYRFFPAELVFFMLGYLSYSIYKKIREKKIKPVYYNLLWIFMIAFTLFYSEVSFTQKENLYFLFFFLALPFIFHHTKNIKMDRYIGELSYPIYISHFFILNLLTAFNITLPGGLGLTLSVFTILFSILLNEFVAKRIEKKRQNRLLPA
ncbi:MAG: acyltransferase [Bacteroidia bacterium]